MNPALMIPKKTRVYRVPSEQDAVIETSRLVSRSKWFICTPLPDDAFEFVVKDEP